MIARPSSAATAAEGWSGAGRPWRRGVPANAGQFESAYPGAQDYGVGDSSPGRVALDFLMAGKNVAGFRQKRPRERPSDCSGPPVEPLRRRRAARLRKNPLCRDAAIRKERLRIRYRSRSSRIKSVLPSSVGSKATNWVTLAAPRPIRAAVRAPWLRFQGPDDLGQTAGKAPTAAFLILLGASAFWR